MRRALLSARLLVAFPSAAQPGPPSAERDRGWFAFGYGLGRPDDLAGVITANFGRERVIQVGFHGVTDFALGGSVASVSALHVGPGLSRVSRWDRTALFVSPAVVWGQRTTTDDRFVTAGVVVSGQAVLTPVREVGLGLDVFVTLNAVRPAYGAALTFVFEANK